MAEYVSRSIWQQEVNTLAAASDGQAASASAPTLGAPRAPSALAVASRGLARGDCARACAAFAREGSAASPPSSDIDEEDEDADEDEDEDDEGLSAGESSKPSESRSISVVAGSFVSPTKPRGLGDASGASNSGTPTKKDKTKTPPTASKRQAQSLASQAPSSSGASRSTPAFPGKDGQKLFMCVWKICQDFCEVSWRKKLKGKAKSAEKATERLDVEAHNASKSRREDRLPAIDALKQVLASVHSVATAARDRYADLEPLRASLCADIKVINDFLVEQRPKFSKDGARKAASEMRKLQVVFSKERGGRVNCQDVFGYQESWV